MPMEQTQTVCKRSYYNGVSRMSLSRLRVVPAPDTLIPGVAMLLLLALFPAPSLAQVSNADFNRYCREKFDQSAFGTLLRTDNSLACAQKRSGSILYHKVQASDVCLNQYATRAFRRNGIVIICIKTQTSQPQQAERSIDLAKYCRKNFGTTAFLTRRRIDNTPMCTVRTDGGLGLRHNIIDTNALCGGGSVKVNNETLNCGSTSTSSPLTKADKDTIGASENKNKITPAEYERLRKRKFPPLRPEDIIDTDGTGDLTEKSVKFANLRDCGGVLEDWRKISRDPDGLDGLGYELQGVSRLCPGLTGGKVMDFLAYCREVNSSFSWTLKVTPSGRPICWYRSRSEPEQISKLMLMDTLASTGFICLRAFRNDVGTKYEETKKYIFLSKYKIREAKVECFYMKLDEYIRIIRGIEDRYSEWEM